MSIGPSGRIVIEIDPEIKQELYQVLKMEDLTLKHWFLEQVSTLLKDKHQLPLHLVPRSKALGEN
jgi:hypothetical protein